MAEEQVVIDDSTGLNEVLKGTNQYLQTYDFGLAVARSRITGVTNVNIFGYQSAIGTTQYAVWENVAAYAFPTVAQTMNLVSSNNADTASILIQGLDASRNLISETLTLTGTTPVSTVNSYLRINQIIVATGSATNPAGTVTLKNSSGTPNTITYAQINPGVGKSQMAIYSVPTGYTFYLSRIDASTSLNGNNATYINYRNQNTLSSGVVEYVAQAAFSQNYRIQRVVPLPFATGIDIQFQLSTSTGTATVGIFVEGFLVPNNI
jgi:hypothetical protein